METDADNNNNINGRSSGGGDADDEDNSDDEEYDGNYTNMPTMPETPQQSSLQGIWRPGSEEFDEDAKNRV